MKEPTLTEKLSMVDKWIRFVFMILFVLIAYVVRFIVWLIAAVQFIYLLFVGKPQKDLLSFGDSLSRYVYQIMQFLMFVTEDKPFPFAKWPEPRAPKEPKKVPPPPEKEPPKT